MPTAYPEIKTFTGLFLQKNSFNVPDGAMEEAENIIISKDDKISKRRGFYEYDNPTDTPVALVNYQGKLVSIGETSVGYYTDTGTTPNETGTLTTAGGVAVDCTGIHPKYFEANNNLYATTNNGMIKLESFDSNVFTMGVPPALDLRGKFLSANGVLIADSQVGYRSVFGRKDSNDNLLLGAPSDILILTNTKQISQGYTSVGAVVTVTTANHRLTTGMAITVSDASAATLNGTWTITVLTPSTFQFIAGGAPAPATGTLSYGTTRTPRLEFSIPEEIDDVNLGYFFHVYRTTQSNSASATPTPDFKLIDERKLTATEIANNLAFYEDVIPDILLGAELYTNPNSREGELQANERPPLASDVTFYKQHGVFAGVLSRHLLELDVVDTSKFSSGSYIEIKVDAVTRRYIARSGIGNTTTTATSISGTGTVTITYNGHGLLNGDKVYLSRITGTIPEGEYTVSAAAANTFDITSPGNSATDLDFAGVSDASGYYMWSFDTTSSASIQLRDTARGIVRAINKDPSSLVYARYISLLNDIPGKMRFFAKGFTGTIQLSSQNATVGQGFSPTVTTTPTDTQSESDDNPHLFYMSKISEYEAVPLVNYFPVGSKNKRLLRVAALRDSIIVIKEDGVFRATGDTFYSMTVTLLDSTVICVAPESVAVINNNVIFLSNQGVCLVTESSVQIISRDIEDVIQQILGKAQLASKTHGISYESERIYLLTTLKPNSETETTVYVYNILNNSWTSWDTAFVGGALDNRDRLHLIKESGVIDRERKTQTRVDYCGQNHSCTIISVDPEKLSAVINPASSFPAVGDVLIKDDVFSRIKFVEFTGVYYYVEFLRKTNLSASDTPYLYKRYKATIKLAPFHAGAVGRTKQFSQMQIHTRNYAISVISISFTGNYFGGSNVVEWVDDQAGGGWGGEPWGFFPWGQADGVSLQLYTKPAPVVRVYIPIFQQRNTFVQPVIEHDQAGESLEIQAITFAVRAYQERVTI